MQQMVGLLNFEKIEGLRWAMRRRQAYYDSDSDLSFWLDSVKSKFTLQGPNDCLFLPVLTKSGPAPTDGCTSKQRGPPMHQKPTGADLTMRKWPCRNLWMSMYRNFIQSHSPPENSPSTLKAWILVSWEQSQPQNCRARHHIINSDASALPLTVALASLGASLLQCREWPLPSMTTKASESAHAGNFKTMIKIWIP